MFFRSETTLDQRQYALALTEKVNFGNRGKFDGDRIKQTIGILGEVVLCDLYGVPRPKGANGYDKGIDLVISGKNVDVKTMGRRTFPRMREVSNLQVVQTHQGETDVYLFATYHRGEKVIDYLGWIKKIDIRLGGDIYVAKEGSQVPRSNGTSFTAEDDIWQIPNRVLIPFASPDRFEMDLSMWGK